MTKEEIVVKLAEAFAKHLNVSVTLTAGLVPVSITDGKLYEAYVLSKVLERLDSIENMTLILVGGTKIKLKSSHGPINPAYPHIELYRNGAHVADLWTDVEFLALSYSIQGESSPPTKGHYHELDLVVVDAGTTGRPRGNQIWLGVECKNTAYQKGLLKEILGIRRELSFLTSENPTYFNYWPRNSVPANPPSCLMVFSTDSGVIDYSAPGSIFGIDFEYEPLT